MLFDGLATASTWCKRHGNLTCNLLRGFAFQSRCAKDNICTMNFLVFDNFQDLLFCGKKRPKFGMAPTF